MSSLTSFVVFAVLLSNFMPVNWISMPLHTSDNIFTVRSLRSLYLIDTKPPFLQLVQYCILNLLPHGYIVGKFAMFHPYRKQIASQKCCFDSSKPKSLICCAVSQFDTTFSMVASSNLLECKPIWYTYSLCLHQVIFWISLVYYFLTDLSWCSIDLAFLFLWLV